LEFRNKPRKIASTGFYTSDSSRRQKARDSTTIFPDDHHIFKMYDTPQLPHLKNKFVRTRDLQMSQLNSSRHYGFYPQGSTRTQPNLFMPSEEAEIVIMEEEEEAR
jgi:hypothetical protein